MKENNTSRSSSDPTQLKSEWAPWNIDEPYRTSSDYVEDKLRMDGWVKVMKESDDGMCKGWTDQIDTLIIFAGLFSATVTAFTVESYRWLDETPADTLARLQLRDMLRATQNPAIDQLAPAAFEVHSSSVAINVLWFVSLTLTLAAVVIGFLCKQWLHEYQRYDNYTIKDAFLIHGLRYRGLQAWHVPQIIAFLPILLQTALVLFLVGLLILLRPLQTIVLSIVGTIVGLTFLFLGATTLLPAFQYIFPKFRTQCPYKSSQSWYFLFISALWWFGSSVPTTWASLDHWEVTHVCDGMGHTLSRVYGLVSNNIDAFWSIYSYLADVSRKPSIKADLSLLSDFIDGLDASRKNDITKAVSLIDEDSFLFQRTQQLRIYTDVHHGQPMDHLPLERSFDKINTTSFAYQLRIHKTFMHFLKSDVHFSNVMVFNRYLEHWARCSENGKAGLEAMVQWKMSDIGTHHGWHPGNASYIVKIHSQVLKDQTLNSMSTLPTSLFSVIPGLLDSYDQCRFDPSPFTLLKDIQDWIDRLPDDISKFNNAEIILLRLIHQTDLFFKTRRLNESDKQYLRSFAQFFVGFSKQYKRRWLQFLMKYEERWEGQFIKESMDILANYLGQVVSTPS